MNFPEFIVIPVSEPKSRVGPSDSEIHGKGIFCETLCERFVHLVRTDAHNKTSIREGVTSKWGYSVEFRYEKTFQAYARLV